MIAKIKIRKSDLFYYLFLSMIVFYYSMHQTTIDISALKGYFLVLSVFFLIMYTVLNKWKMDKRFIAIVAVYGALALGNCIYTNDGQFLYFVLVVLFLYDIPLKNVFYLLFYEKMIFTILIILGAWMGWVENITNVRSDGTVRYAMGFTHPNQCALNIGILIFLYLCIKKDKLNRARYTIVFLMLLLCYLVTNSRTGTACILLGILLVLCRNSRIFRRCFPYIAKGSCFLLMVLSIYLPIQSGLDFIPLIGRILPDSVGNVILNLVDVINTCLNHRLELGNRYFLAYNVSLFGEELDLDVLKKTYSYIVLDSGYLNLFFGFGLIGSFLFLLLQQRTISWLLKKGEMVYAIILFMFFVWGFTENIFMSLGRNFCFVFCAMYLRNLTAWNSQKSEVLECRQS